MIPLLLCLGLLFAPALVSRFNRQEPRSTPPGGVSRLSSASLARPADDRAGRGGNLDMLPPVSPAPTTTHVHPVVVSTTAATTTAPPTTAPPTTTTTAAAQNSQTGRASWYEAASTGSCAHRSLPKGTVVKVANAATGGSVTCQVNDRGPYVDGRIIDLSQADFERVAGSHEGVIDVIIHW